MDLPDVWFEIAHLIRADGVKAFIFTCKMFRAVMGAAQPDYATRYCNHLRTLVKMFPDKPWNTTYLQENPYFLRDEKFRYLDEPSCVDASLTVRQNMEKLRNANKYFSMSFVFRHPALKNEILAEFLTLKALMRENAQCFADDTLSVNPALTWKDVVEHPEVNWNWTYMSRMCYN